MHSYDVAGYHIRGFLEGLRALQLDVEQLLRDSGIDRATLDETEVRFPEPQVLMLWMGAERQYDKPTFGIDMALSIPFGRFELIDYLVAACPTVGAGVECLGHHARLCASGFLYRIEPHTHEGQRGQRIVTEHRHPIAALPSSLLEYTWTLMITRFRHVCGNAFAPQLWLREKPRASSKQLVDVLGRLPEIAAQDALFVPWTQWELPNQHHDPMLGKILLSHARDVEARLPASDFLGALQGAITFALHSGDPSIGRIGSRLGLSPRTLQRRLEVEGVTFQGILEQVRRELALRYLTSTQLSLAEISALLAYADISAFGRAFRRWIGSSPTSFRQQQREQPLHRAETRSESREARDARDQGATSTELLGSS